MCRILGITSKYEFDVSNHLKQFAKMALNSKEYQGHGWGMAFLKGGTWKSYHSIKPIWEDNLEQFERSSRILVHARSAFQDEGIKVENNMPFVLDDLIFIFNGELRGVRIKENGRIGAEKIFNFIYRFKKYGIKNAINKSIPIINKRADYIRALNFIIADEDNFYISNYFNEDPEYFNLKITRSDNLIIISSEKYDKDLEWHNLDNYKVEVVECY